MDPQEGTEGLGAVGNGIEMGWVRYPCVRNVLLGGSDSGSVVWIGTVVPIGGDDEDCGGKPYDVVHP